MNSIKSNNIINIISKKDLFKRYFYLIIGLFVYACTFNLFMLPNEIVAGGLGGIAIIMKDVISPSLLIFILSVILLIMSYFLLGKEKTSASIVGSLLYPLFVKLTSNIGNIISINNQDLLLIALFTGVFTGIASGIIFKNGFTTGGTDILNQIVAKYFKRSIGTSMLLTDGLIVLAGGFFFGWNKVMYAVIILYILSIIADKVILGISDNKAFYIITNKDEEIQKFILDNLSHGVTVLDAKGGYSGESNRVLMCIIPAKDYFKLKEGISLIDNDAFFVVADAYEVMGGS
jgi:uncharacterized membrane-anchored protein YitT (DUF2179 family)